MSSTTNTTWPKMYGLRQSPRRRGLHRWRCAHDLMIVGCEPTILITTRTLQAEWETSPAQEVNSETKVKFLGKELKKGPKGEFIASQKDNIKDKEGIKGGMGVKVPMGKASCPTPMPEEPTQDLQKLVGELVLEVFSDSSFAANQETRDASIARLCHSHLERGE